MATKAPDMVKIELFKDSGKYKDDVTVGLNGKIYRIQRGVPVEVPRAVAEILDHSKIQDKETIKYIEGLEAEYLEKLKNL